MNFNANLDQGIINKLDNLLKSSEYSSLIECYASVVFLEAYNKKLKDFTESKYEILNKEEVNEAHKRLEKAESEWTSCNERIGRFFHINKFTVIMTVIILITICAGLMKEVMQNASGTEIDFLTAFKGLLDFNNWALIPSVLDSEEIIIYVILLILSLIQSGWTLAISLFVGLMMLDFSDILSWTAMSRLYIACVAIFVLNIFLYKPIMRFFNRVIIKQKGKELHEAQTQVNNLKQENINRKKERNRLFEEQLQNDNAKQLEVCKETLENSFICKKYGHKLEIHNEESLKNVWAEMIYLMFVYDTYEDKIQNIKDLRRFYEEEKRKDRIEEKTADTNKKINSLLEKQGVINSILDDRISYLELNYNSISVENDSLRREVEDLDRKVRSTW